MTQNASHPVLTRIAFALLWLFVFTLPLTQIVEIPMLATVSKFVGLAALAAGAIVVAARRKVRLLSPIHMALAGFVIWSAVTLCWSVAPALTAQRASTYFQLFLLVLLVWELCEGEKDVLRILQAFALGTIGPALSILYAFLPGADTLARRAAAGVGTDGLAFLLALSLPVSYYLILRDKSPLSAIYRLQMGFAVLAILLAGSAAMLIAMAVGLSLFCWTFHLLPVRSRLGAFTAVLLLAGLTFLLMPAGIWQHVASESRSGGITLTAALDGGLRTLQSTPAGGFGAGSLPVSAVSSKTPFVMFAETGVMGVMCFVILLGVLFLAAERMSGATRSFWFTVLGVWIVGTCALNWEACPPAWLLIGLLASHSACVRTEGVTSEEQAKKRNYYVERTAEVWS